LVRLTFNQIVNAVGALINPALARSVAATHSIPDPRERFFPPLNDPREGWVITDTRWIKGDAIAQQVSQYVLDNFAAVTGCGTDPTDGCAQSFVAGFAERAYRRPLLDDEKARLDQVYSEVKAVGSSVSEAAQTSVHAVLGAPQFLYRTEFGDDSRVEGPLSPPELASALSFFLTDAPPDAPLLDAARHGALATRADIDTQAARLLGSEVSKSNLQQAMFAYFGAGGVKDAVLPDVPIFTVHMRDAMFREAVLFMNDTLWGPKVTDLITSRRTFINAALAEHVYRVPWPPPGVVLDADGFGPVELPDTRAGVLTLASHLTARARPPDASVVLRGLLIHRLILCLEPPPFPPDLIDVVADAGVRLQGQTERTKAEYRATTPPCSSCHPIFDPYGLVLDRFDVMGRYRTEDAQGRPIATGVTLPPAVGGAKVESVQDMAQLFASSNLFTSCMAMQLSRYALPEPIAIKTDSCTTKMVAGEFAASDGSFPALVRAVAGSRALTHRAAGR
jgi:Protein of unknown function (DUF1592)/Protein of unknown function (DUF1588)/Protein of unknown function (DUF1595)/Protein of unknown function (DUF1585)